MLCLYVYNVLPPQRLPGSFEDLLCNGQRKIKETRFKKKKKKKKKKIMYRHFLDLSLDLRCLHFFVSADITVGHRCPSLHIKGAAVK